MSAGFDAVRYRSVGDDLIGSFLCWWFLLSADVIVYAEQYRSVGEDLVGFVCVFCCRQMLSLVRCTIDQLAMTVSWSFLPMGYSYDWKIFC